MNDFVIYPKNSEKTFTIKLHRFEVGERDVTLFNSANAVSDFGFLAKDKIAAIASSNPRTTKEAIEFLVHLNGDRVITVYADSFRVERELTFYWNGPQPKPISGLYIDISDVIGVIPSIGLETYIGDTMTSRHL